MGVNIQTVILATQQGSIVPSLHYLMDGGMLYSLMDCSWPACQLEIGGCRTVGTRLAVWVGEITGEPAAPAQRVPEPNIYVLIRKAVSGPRTPCATDAEALSASCWRREWTHDLPAAQPLRFVLRVEIERFLHTM